jgi:dihydroxyacetone kinase
VKQHDDGVKKLINAAADVVGEALDGLTLTAAGVSRLAGSTIALRSDLADVRAAGRVAVLSGGGAGHEPAHAGYVGAGMLTGAIAGDVFTSPSVDAVLAAIRAVASPGGVLLVVKNYTGDRLNFGLAAELARAEGIAVETVVVADDVALTAVGGAGRRGLAGTVLVHKVAGAAAEAGSPLAEVTARARAAAEAVGTMGLALTPCTVPAAGRPGFDLADDEMEWGLGIHGEPGVERSAVQPVDRVVQRLLGRIVEDGGVGTGSRVALVVNGLGATPPMELSIVAGAAVRDLRGRGVTVERLLVGNLLTALDMAGCSLSVLAVDDDLLAALDAPTTAPAWPQVSSTVEARTVQPAPVEAGPAGTLDADDPLRRVLEAVAHALIAADAELTAMDREVGDGDLGISLARGAAAILRECPAYPGGDGPAAVLRAASATVRRSVGGTSGPLYAVLLLRAAAALEGAADAGPRAWAAALRAGIDGVRQVGGADVGDRTMIDALVPAADALHTGLAGSGAIQSLAGSGSDGSGTGQDGDWRRALDAAVEAAREGTAGTAAVQARLGRSSYLGARVLGHPDPGARAVVIWLEAVATALSRP